MSRPMRPQRLAQIKRDVPNVKDGYAAGMIEELVAEVERLAGTVGRVVAVLSSPEPS